MIPFHFQTGPRGRQRTVKTAFRGEELLHQPLLNKGSAFSAEERQVFGLNGLLPPGVSTIEQQLARVYENISCKPEPLEKFIGLAGLQDRNEVLFYRALTEHVEEFLPIIYTPTVGLACQRYSHVFRRPRGLWITPGDTGRIYELLGNAPVDDVRLIVVTDGERILGLGDQGAGGMGIPVGKLALYTLAAGIHPSSTLPVCLDVGTDNSALRADELYLGWKAPRLRGPEYDALVDEFVTAVKRRFPRALLQWEDFKKQNAFNLLDRYRHSLPSFNDDIQGTAAVATAGILAACRATNTPISKSRIVILGAGAAGVGIARQLRELIKVSGVTGTDLVRSIALLDTGGMLIEGRDFKEPAKREFAWPADLAAAFGLSPREPGNLLAVVEAIRPTVLIGTSGEAGCFTEQVVRAMASQCERPAIFPFSNPTANSEAIPSDLIQWTDGRVLIATGSPFPPVKFDGRTLKIGQGNNVYIFPGLGLGAVVAEARLVTDSMFNAAAQTLASCVTEEDLAAGLLYPPLTQLRAVSAKIATAVVKTARDEGVGRAIPDDAIEHAVIDAMWTPEYPTLEPE